MKPACKFLMITAAVGVGVPAVLLVGLLVAYFAEIPLPVSSSQFRNDWKFDDLITQGNDVIGGGYSFAEGRDIWIRIRLNQKPNFEEDPTGDPCSREELEKIRNWFLERTRPQKILGIIPISPGAPADKAALQDAAQLRCHSTERHTPITHRFGEYPRGCTFSWKLYHEPSRFYYERSACSH